MTSFYEYMDEISIDPELICSICRLPLTDPCCTPCGETFCRACINNWIKTKSSSCPHCRQNLSIDELSSAPRLLRNMLDRLQVECLVCGETGILRINIEEHMQKRCPKTIVSCHSADIKCPWMGQRDQLDDHLIACRFEGMRSVITELVMENQQMEEKVDEQMNQINHLTKLLKLQEDQCVALKSKYETLVKQENQWKSQIHTYEHQTQQLLQELQEKEAELTCIRNQPSQLDIKYSFITIYE